MNRVYFDIETSPLPLEQLAKALPEFEAPANYKDPAKIQEYKDRQKSEWLEKAALDARTGRVLCIGLQRPSVTGKLIADILDDDDEASLLQDFWGMFTTHDYKEVPFVGFNIRGFDVPFLMRRSWALGVSVPKAAFDGRYLSRRFVDLMELWQCFNRSQERISLDALSKFLGVGEKNGKGADFAKLWASDRAKALEYLHNDLALVHAAAERMGVEHWFPKLEEEAEAA